MILRGYVLFLPGDPVKRCRHSVQRNTCNVCRRFRCLPFLTVFLHPHFGQRGFCCVASASIPEGGLAGEERRCRYLVMTSVNRTVARLSNLGQEFCAGGSRIFQEAWVADFAWWCGGEMALRSRNCFWWCFGAA